MPQIEVSMELYGNFEMLRVIAEDKATNKSQTFTFRLHNYLSCEQAERMKRKKKEYQEKERKEAERIHTRTKLKSFILFVKTDIMKNGRDELALAEQIDSDARRLIENALNDASAWLDANPNASKDEYAEKLKELELLLHHFG